ncbi:LytTR family DNA-binding domain-containing protein [Paraflavisolibacter sp. H34]|uniref:LytR/AlgR family response regulator transcription factor n=1 Tax=Huijunlia imazamoxiresistens TaxID=3127457 RepID=UPI00301A8CF8
MIRCIAIDDEPLALELLEDNIRQVPFLQLLGGFSNPLEAMRFLQEQPVDLVFLDIQMPGLTGLQFIRSLPHKPMFILVTAYGKYALEGFELSVVDYLVKPVDLARFIQACNKAKELFDLKDRSKAAGEGAVPDYIFVNVEYSLLKLVLSDILWIEGLKDYIKIHLKSATRPVLTRMSMKGMEELLPPSAFLRVHKSFIVSKAAITAIRKNRVFVGDMELPVGENYKEALEAFANRR